jgi:hypothetical protein
MLLSKSLTGVCLDFGTPEEVKKLIDRLREELLWMALVLSFVVNWFFGIRFDV